MQFCVNREVDCFARLESDWSFFLALYIYFHCLSLVILGPGLTKAVYFGYLGVEMDARPQIFMKTGMPARLINVQVSI